MNPLTLKNSFEQSSESFLSTKNKMITSFYHENPHINFEENNLLMINILKMCNGIKINNGTANSNSNGPSFLQTDYTSGSLSSLNNCVKGEDNLEIVLNKINPTSNIVRNMKTDHFYDFMITIEKKQKIIVESKEINTNINSEQVELFLNTCKEVKCNGIFISQSSGIINKYNYQIDIISKNVIVYIHFANYDQDKIKIAFDMIDSISERLNYINMSGDFFITKNLLMEINEEYQFFIKQKEELKIYIKQHENNLLNQLQDIKFNNLNNYLSSKITTNEKIGIYKCNLCNFYTSNTLKGMAAHKKGCKKKQNMNIL